MLCVDMHANALTAERSRLLFTISVHEVNPPEFVLL